MLNWYDDVKAFHEAFYHPVAESPQLVERKRAIARYKWMLEELDEFMAAENVTEQADAMIDLIYFALGTLVEMGVRPERIFAAVQAANMAKLFPDGRPRYNELGKVIKPEGWEPPDEKIRQMIESGDL